MFDVKFVVILIRLLKYLFFRFFCTYIVTFGYKFIFKRNWKNMLIQERGFADLLEASSIICPIFYTNLFIKYILIV